MEVGSIDWDLNYIFSTYRSNFSSLLFKLFKDSLKKCSTIGGRVGGIFSYGSLLISILECTKHSSALLRFVGWLCFRLGLISSSSFYLSSLAFSNKFFFLRRSWNARFRLNESCIDANLVDNFSFSGRPNSTVDPLASSHSCSSTKSLLFFSSCNIELLRDFAAIWAS